MRVVELFAGIGAQRMALTLAGIPHEVVAISEIDRHALASYEAIWGDCPNLGDITKIDRLPPCDLVTYSFPCVDLSLAGKRAGMAEGSGTRSGLVWEVTRLLEGAEERPEWPLMENVPQVLTAPEWPSLLRRLADMGYHNKWVKADSSKFGSAQKRVRAFMVSRLSADPPDLPESAPNAPTLCLRDVMEAERGERFVRRIPLDRIKWRQPKEGYRHPQSAGLDCPLMDASDPRMETRRIASEDSLCPAIRRGALQKTVEEEEEEERVKPLVAVADNLRNAPKGRKAVGTVTAGGERLKVAPSDGARDTRPVAEDTGISSPIRRKLYSPETPAPTIMRQRRHGVSAQIRVIDGIAGESTPVAEDESESFYSRRMLYASPSPTLRRLHSIRDMVKVVDRADGGSGIKVAADWDRPEGSDMTNRLYASTSSSPTIRARGGGDRDVKVIADDTGESYERMARLYADEGKAPTIDQLGRRGNQMVKIVDRIEEKGVIEKDGTWDMNVPHRTRFREQRIVGTGGKAPTLAVKSEAKVKTTEEEEEDCLIVNILTPRECWRLMGFPEWAFIRASRVSSETQLYNQAGNSIVVEVLIAIFNAMFRPPKRRVQMTLEALA